MGPAEPALRPHALPGHPSRTGRGVRPRTPWGHPSRGEEPKPGLHGPTGPRSSPLDSSSKTSCPHDRKVKLITTMGAHLTSLCRPAGPGRGGTGFSCKGSASKAPLGASGAQRPLRSPSGVRASAGKLLSATKSQLVNHYGAIFQALDQMETIKPFQKKKKKGTNVELGPVLRVSLLSGDDVTLWVLGWGLVRLPCALEAS